MLLNQERNFPILHYYDQDIISLYDHAWNRIEFYWKEDENKSKKATAHYLDHPEMETLSLTDVAFSSFALSYLGNGSKAAETLDFFYNQQEEDGAIRCEYDKNTKKPIFPRGNPDGLAPPILIWAEHNYFNRTDNKQRLKVILPQLDAYLTWIQKTCLQSNGLFACSLAATGMHNSPRKHAHYLIDFNAQMAAAYNYMNILATFVNNRNLNFKYAKAYYQLKTLINEHFWNETDNFYYDLDKNMRPVKVKTIASFWTLLAKIPNNIQTNDFIKYLSDPNHFGTDHPFPSLSKSEKDYNKSGQGFRGSVFPLYTYMIVKGLDQYEKHEFSRECGLKHIYNIFETWINTQNPECEFGSFWEAYEPEAAQPAKPSSRTHKIKEDYIATNAPSIIALMIENTIGVNICTPRKIAVWVVPHLETLGIENIRMKRNPISTIIQKTNRGWNIRHNSEKLYYFSIQILSMNKEKTIPIPSGRCSMILEKL